MGSSDAAIISIGPVVFLLVVIGCFCYCCWKCCKCCQECGRKPQHHVTVVNEVTQPLAPVSHVVQHVPPPQSANHPSMRSEQFQQMGAPHPYYPQSPPPPYSMGQQQYPGMVVSPQQVNYYPQSQPMPQPYPPMLPPQPPMPNMNYNPLTPPHCPLPPIPQQPLPPIPQQQNSPLDQGDKQPEYNPNYPMPSAP